MIQTTTEAGIEQNPVLAAVTFKFKGFRVDTGGWVYGDLIHNCPDINLRYCVGIKAGKVSPVEVHPQSVGQFTGLCDRAGADIYSNDILAPYGNITMEPKMDECFSVEFSKGSYNIGNESDTDYYIVGNTYTTPELLNNGSNSR